MLLPHFNGVVLQYDYLSQIRLVVNHMQIFYEKPDSLFFSLSVKSLINVHQIAQKNGTEKLTAGYT